MNGKPKRFAADFVVRPGLLEELGKEDTGCNKRSPGKQHDDSVGFGQLHVAIARVPIELDRLLSIQLDQS